MSFASSISVFQPLDSDCFAVLKKKIFKIYRHAEEIMRGRGLSHYNVCTSVVADAEGGRPWLRLSLIPSRDTCADF